MPHDQAGRDPPSRPASFPCAPWFVVFVCYNYRQMKSAPTAMGRMPRFSSASPRADGFRAIEARPLFVMPPPARSTRMRSFPKLLAPPFQGPYSMGARMGLAMEATPSASVPFAGDIKNPLCPPDGDSPRPVPRLSQRPRHRPHPRKRGVPGIPERAGPRLPRSPPRALIGTDRLMAPDYPCIPVIRPNRAWSVSLRERNRPT